MWKEKAVSAAVDVRGLAQAGVITEGEGVIVVERVERAPVMAVAVLSRVALVLPRAIPSVRGRRHSDVAEDIERRLVRFERAIAIGVGVDDDSIISVEVESSGQGVTQRVSLCEHLVAGDVYFSRRQSA